eukprot:1177083-Prorocentrum_minimum.AAC.4
MLRPDSGESISQVLKFAKEPEILARSVGSSRVDIKHCVEAIEAIRFSPDGKRLAVGSHDNFVDVYDTTRHKFQRLCRCTGHSSFITHLDWSVPDPQRPEYRVRAAVLVLYLVVHCYCTVTVSVLSPGLVGAGPPAARVIMSTDGAHELLHFDGN